MVGEKGGPPSVKVAHVYVVLRYLIYTVFSLIPSNQLVEKKRGYQPKRNQSEIMGTKNSFGDHTAFDS